MGEKIPRLDSDGNIEGYDEQNGDKIIHYGTGFFPEILGHSEIKDGEITHYGTGTFPEILGHSEIKDDRVDHYGTGTFPEKTGHSEVTDEKATHYGPGSFPQITGRGGTPYKGSESKSQSAKDSASSEASDIGCGDSYSAGDSYSGSSSSDEGWGGIGGILGTLMGVAGTFGGGLVALVLAGALLTSKPEDDQKWKNVYRINLEYRDYKQMDRDNDYKVSEEEFFKKYPCAKKMIAGTGNRFQLFCHTEVNFNGHRNLSCKDIKNIVNTGPGVLWKINGRYDSKVDTHFMGYR